MTSLVIPIKQIKLRKMKMTLKQPFSTSFGTVEEKVFFVTEIMDGTYTGYGESVAFTTPWYTEETTETVFHVMDRFLIPLLKKYPIQHPNDVTEIFQSIRRNNMAKSAIEGAVWDLYAKRCGQSLAEAIGGGTVDTIGVGLSIGLKPTMDKLLQSIDEAVQEGYKRVKIKIDRHRDIDVVKEVRRHFPDIPLMVDANSAYTLHDMDHLKKLDDYNLMMIEQPLGHDDILEHAELQKVMKTPICLDESIHSLHDVQLATQLKSCQI